METGKLMIVIRFYDEHNQLLDEVDIVAGAKQAIPLDAQHMIVTEKT
jgi:hypothetical protein